MGMSGKWSVSTNEENYHGIYDTSEEAIEEGKQYGRPFWIGQCVPPVSPEYLWDADTWINQLYEHEDYAGEWAEDAIQATKDQLEDLERSVSGAISGWLDRHDLRPTFFNIDPLTVRKVEP